MHGWMAWRRPGGITRWHPACHSRQPQGGRRERRDGEGGGTPIPYAVRRDDNLTWCRYPSRLGSQGGQAARRRPSSIEELTPACTETVEKMQPLPCTLYRHRHRLRLGLGLGLRLGYHFGAGALKRHPCSNHTWSMEYAAIVRSFIAALPNKNLTTQAARRNFGQTCDGVPTLRFWAFANLQVPKRSSQNGVRSTSSTAKATAARVLWCSELQRVAADLVLVHPGRR